LVRFLSVALVAASTLPDFDAYDRFAKKWISSAVIDNITTNSINYSGLAQDPDYYKFLGSLESLDYAGWTPEEAMAVMINAYNVMAMGFLIQEPCLRTNSTCIPMPSIMNCSTDPGSTIFQMPCGLIGGHMWNLERIEYFLRQPVSFREDPRIHAAIVCASVSCPNTRLEAYRPELIYDQLADQMRDFLSNPKKGFALDKANMTATFSAIFSKYAIDFEQTSAGSFLNYTLPYLPSDARDFISKNMDKIKLAPPFHYDWNVTGVVACHC